MLLQIQTKPFGNLTSLIISFDSLNFIRPSIMTETSAQKWTAPPAGSPCWIEIPASDVPACKEFYSQLFPSWSFKPATEAYKGDKIAMWSFASPSGLTGGIVQVPAECKATELKNGMGVTIYHYVESIEDTQKRVEELGGTSCSGKEPEGENGWYMYFKDVAGNRFGTYTLK